MQSCPFSRPEMAVCGSRYPPALRWCWFQHCAPIAMVMSRESFSSWPGRATCIKERINQGYSLTFERSQSRETWKFELLMEEIQQCGQLTPGEEKGQEKGHILGGSEVACPTPTISLKSLTVPDFWFCTVCTVSPCVFTYICVFFKQTFQRWKIHISRQ